MIKESFMRIMLLALCFFCPAQAQDAVPQGERELPSSVQEVQLPGTLSPSVLRQMRVSTIPLGDVVRTVPRRASMVTLGGNAAESALGLEDGARIALPDTASTDTRKGHTIDLAALRQQDGVGAVELYQAGTKIEVTGTDSFEISQGQIVAVRDPSAIPVTVQESDGTQSASPTRLITLDATGAIRQLSLVHRVQNMTWNFDLDRFTGVILIGLIDRAHPHKQARLANPISVQLLAAGAALVPHELAIDRIGGRFEKIDVSIPNPDDPFVIQLVSTVDQDVPPATVPLNRIPVVIMAPARIDAFGIETGKVTVRARNGRLRSGSVVTLDLDNGALGHHDLKVDDTGVAITTLRSTRLGEGQLKVLGGPYVATPVTVRYMPPVLFLGATLIGAMLGAAIFVYALSRGGNRRRLFIDWAVGVIVGAGVTAMLYAGMELPPWLPTPKDLVGAIGPLAMAFVAAAMATSIIVLLTGVRPDSSSQRVARTKRK